MENRRNYYRILHVQFDAPEAVIRASYRTIMHKLRQHPDLGGDHWNATVINEAYAVLIDAVRRAAYDKTFLADHGKEASAKPKPSAPDEKASTGTASESDQSSSQADAKASGGSSAGAAGTMATCPFCGHGNVLIANECGRCRSPSTPVPQVSATIGARRQIERITVRDRVDFYDSWPQRQPYTGELRDLSPKGCQLIALRPVHRGKCIKIDTSLFAAIGTVQACRGHDSESGRLYVLAIEFLTLRFIRPEGSFVSVNA